jgi:hypothetical protein
MGVNKQSGEYLARKDRASIDELREDDYEAAFQQAVKWRHRIKTCKATLAESSPRVMWGHVDALIKVATAWRGQYLASLPLPGKGRQSD